MENAIKTYMKIGVVLGCGMSVGGIASSMAGHGFRSEEYDAHPILETVSTIVLEGLLWPLELSIQVNKLNNRQ